MGATLSAQIAENAARIVDLPGRGRYRAQARQIVGRLVIGRLQPGATMPVRVDPDDPAQLTVDEPAMLCTTGWYHELSD